MLYISIDCVTQRSHPARCYLRMWLLYEDHSIDNKNYVWRHCDCQFKECCKIL